MFINFNHNSLTRLIIKKLKGEEGREESCKQRSCKDSYKQNHLLSQERLF